MYRDKLLMLVAEKGQKRVADFIGCSQPTVSRIVNGKLPSTEYVIPLSILLSMSANELLLEMHPEQKKHTRGCSK